MRIQSFNQLGVTARIVVVSLIPVALLFIATVVFAYVTRAAEVDAELDERGRVLAATLADGSDYAIISGNDSSLRQSLGSILQADRNIAGIEIVDAAGHARIVLPAGFSPPDRWPVFTALIKREVVLDDAFTSELEPHVPSAQSSRTVRAEVVGTVRVTMDPTHLLERQSRRMLIDVTLALAALVATVALGVMLIRRLLTPLSTVMAALHQIGAGQYNVSFPRRAPGEVGRLQMSVLEAAASLREYRHHMDSLVAERTRALEAARSDLEKADGERRLLIKNVTTALEEERKAIAIDIHDHLNASLIVIKLHIGRIHDLAEQYDHDVARTICEIAGYANDEVSTIYAAARGIVKRLRPEIIDTLGLRDAVEEMVQQYGCLHANCSFDFSATGDFSEIEGDLAIAAYRLVQEALSNVIKHASAGHVCVDLDNNPLDHALEIRVKDDGRGFDAAVVTPGVGMIGMRERAFSLGGFIEWNSAPGKGTIVYMSIPLARNGPLAMSTNAQNTQLDSRSNASKPS